MTFDLNAQVNYAFTMFSATLAKYTSGSFSLVITGTFLYGYFHKEDRMISVATFQW